MEEKIMNEDTELYLALDEPVEAKNEPATEDEPTREPISVIKDTPTAVRVGEIPSFRERNKKIFRMSDGTEQEVFYASDVHTLDEEDGQYKDIENTIIEEADGKHFVCGKHSFIAKFSNNEKDDELFSIEQGVHKVSVLAKKNYKNKNKGRKPDIRKRSFDSGDESKIVSFGEIEEDSIYEYTVESSGIKENIIVKGTKKTYRYPFILKCENLKAVLDAEQERVSFTDLESNEEIFHIPAPFMVDNNNAASMAVSYELVAKENSDPVLTIVADSEWINHEERAFPITIDPQIKVTNADILATYSWNSNNYMYHADEHTVGIVATANPTDTSCEEIDYSEISNNSMKDALDLTYNKWTLGRISNANDFVWYKFVADVEEAHNDECIGNYTFYTSGSLDTVGFLYDETGKQIAYNDDSNGYNFAIAANLTFGKTYYLKVKAWSTRTGSYKVSCVATDKYCCGDLSPDAPTYTYSRNRMYLDFNYPDLSHGARIKKAELKVYRKSVSSNSSNAQIGLYHINDEICNHCYYEPSIEGSLIDYDAVNVNGSNICYTFDITTLIDRLNQGELYHNKFVLKLVDETLESNNNVVIYGASSVNYKPELVITYEPNYAVNTSYQANTHQIGKFGQASIDLKYGNLTFDSTDFAWAGNRMPITIKHLYNSILFDKQYTKNTSIKLNTANFEAMNVGNGFRLNLMQSMCLVGGEYIYTDENGAETILTLSDDCTYKNEDQDISYTSCDSTLAIGDEKLIFDNERLIEIINNKNKIKINYNEFNQIETVIDSVDRTFQFNYSGNDLISIIAPDGTSVQYTYSGNYLSTVTYPDGTKVVIEYSFDKPASVTLADANGNNIYKNEYEYDGYKVTSVTEYGVENNIFVKGSRSEYSYCMASNRTTVTSSGLENDCDESNVVQTVYTFDDDGNVISDYAYSKETGNTGVDGQTSGIHPYFADDSARIILNNTNLLYNHSFANNSKEHWEVSNECSAHTNMYIASLDDKFRKYAMIIESTDSATTNNIVSQNTISLTAGEYTFSAYIKVAERFEGTKPGVFLRVSALDGTVLAVSEKLENTNSHYIRLIAPFEIKTAQFVKVEFVLDGCGKVCVCAPQLENNPFANDYNMLQNGNFELGGSYWYPYTNCSVNTGTRFNMSNSMRMIGDINGIRYCRQQILPISDRSVRETFTLSGWAKGYGLPMHKRNGTRVPTFRLRADICYSDNTTETHTADFSSCTEEWQFTSLQFSKEKFKKVNYINIYCDYDYNFGTAFFDDIQLVRNAIEKDLTEDAFDNEIEEIPEYEEINTTNAIDDAEPEGFAEATDDFGNATTETIFNDGEFGTIYRSFKFAENGNDLVTETDARGNKTIYEVDADTSRNKEISDRCGNKTSYEYDGIGRTTKVTSKNADGAEVAHVSYTYDAFDNMTEIARGDGMKYSLKYNAFHNLESIGVEGKAEALVKYTYKNGNGKLKEITYANGDKMIATYNSVGKMIGEQWFNKEKAIIAHYKYVYNSNGNIVRSIDIMAEREYNYIYNEGKLIEAITYSIKLSGDNIVEKTSTDNIRYIYDSDGNMTKKIITAGDDAPFIYNFETNDDKTVVKFDAVNDAVSYHSKADNFGRRIFDELQLGSGFISRRFEYVMGETTDEHIKSGNLKSSPTTHLVSRILLSDGRTIEYEYDAEERITKVIDSIDGTTEYTYDALGQLLTERVNGHIINSMTYDTYGNIIEKNGQTYFYDSTWHDLLLRIDSESIEYDKQGNPIKYLGHTLSWEKGRQLKSFDDNTYTYNANGIRTSKTVNGVKHEYTLDGTKILKETWGENTLIPLYDDEDCVCGIIYNGFSYYFVKNLQGDVIAITNNKGKVVASYTYDAWGVCKIVSDSTGIIARINPFRYRGYCFDQEIGLYYLQSRYYDAGVGRFLNSDNVDYLGLAGTAASYNLFTYCENDCVDFVDYFGHAPSVSTLTRMHNAVVQSAQSFLLSVGTITTSEVRTCNSKGKYVGRMDIYSQISNKVWEVKRNNYAGITAGKRQLNEYTSSYIYSLYHSRFRIRKKPRMGTINVYGCTIVSGYLVTYQSYANNPALILYDYMTLEKAAELLFIAAMATSSAFINALARSAKKTQEKVNTVLAQIRGILAKINSTTRKFIDAIKEFLKNALPIILAIIAIVIIIFILCSSVVVLA